MYNILKLNEISSVTDKIFDKKLFNVTDVNKNPEGVIVRSFDMVNNYSLNGNLLAVARAGAGVNNIPVDAYAKKGIVVFNTPGANANAVKELVITNLLLGSRKIIPSIKWTEGLKGKGADVPKLVEKGKNTFVGGEILGKKLGVIGLGAIGAMVANTAVDLGMEVLGYDPYVSVEAAWSLSRKIKRCLDINELYNECDYITIHVPYMPATKEMLNKKAFSIFKKGAALINCARGELVNNADVIEAVNNGTLSRYITDFPSDDLIGIENIICIPHLGASTPEAEDNCAYMAARELSDYLLNGNIKNSVNYADCVLNRVGETRICVFHLNVKEMINKITGAVSKLGYNIENFIDKSQGDLAYCVMDVMQKIPENIAEELLKIEGIYKVRVI